ncbi:hypothetical protein EBZ37_03900, partial [bacterium]|nr:hypothetical protein [bacterium]
ANGFDSSKSTAADAFISSQIVESLLMPAPEVPQDIRESLGRLKSNQCAEIASEDAELGAVMVTLMPSAQVAQMLAFMSPDAANAVTMASLKMTESEVARRLPKFKAAADRVLSEKKSGGSDFTIRAAELLAEVSPEKEGSIFDALVESGEFDLLKTASRQFFPAQLVSKLPAPVIQACLERLPLTRRAELIFSRGEDSSIYLEAIGPEGSKLREMVGLELNQVNSDELRRRKIEKTKETLWRVGPSSRSGTGSLAV